MQQRARLESLTGLRLLAALLVVAHHTVPVTLAGSFLVSASLSGFVGVTFFFVLSGFVLTWAALTSDLGQERPRTFYRRRFSRIYPLHVLTWVAALASSAVAHEHKSVLGLLLPLLLLQAWVPRENIYFGANTPSWSLSCEAFFYAVFPFVVTRGPRLSRRHSWAVPAVVLVTGLGLICSISVLGNYWATYIFPVYRFLEFATGILLAAAVHEGLRLDLPVWLPAALFTLAATAGLGHLGHPPAVLADALILPFVAILLVVAASADLSGRRTWWRSTPLVTLGQWSFALYLSHYALARLLDRALGERALPRYQGLLLEGAFLVCAVLIAGALYKLVERPTERWLRGRPPREARATSVPPTGDVLI